MNRVSKSMPITIGITIMGVLVQVIAMKGIKKSCTNPGTDSLTWIDLGWLADTYSCSIRQCVGSAETSWLWFPLVPTQ